MQWAQSELGGVFGVRMDFDEMGGAVVDVLVAPIREQGRKGERRDFVAVNQSLTELKRKHGQKLSYPALQDSWFEWARRHLSPEIERGKPVGETQRQHLSPEGYAAALDPAVEARRQQAIEAEARARATLEAAERKEALSNRRDRRARRSAKAIKEAAKIMRHESGAEWFAEAEALGEDAEAALDGDAEADARLRLRYAKGGPAERRLAHTR